MSVTPSWFNTTMTTAATTMSICEIDAFADQLAAWLADLEPATVSGATARDYMAAAGRLDRVMQAAIAVMAKRIDDTGAFKSGGA